MTDSSAVVVCFAGEAWLMGKFKELNELRAVMFDATQGLRSKLESSAIVPTGKSSF